ncbi:MAG: bifunctional riboflavin kinase/FAD synthetase [Acholeplasmataceae bacterium]|jgi:riboflavin kinase/FMN adenylyltransferase|nr:bifunctional riboflavin kinase/FAD synthetase [Acholeplasmataceae bacterium]
MKIVIGPYQNIKNNDPVTLTMGNFDGLHLGHQQLIERVLSYKDTKHAILTFDPHPSSVLRKQPFRTLTQRDDKIELFSRFALDFAFIINFDMPFSHLSVEQFIQFLKDLSVVRLVIGRDARFAYRGEGTIDHLRRYFMVDVVDDMLYNNTRVSTTYIKDFLASGDLGSARKLLHRHYHIKGTVVHGNKVGHKLGFPTANIDYGQYYLPKMGVYYVRILIDDKWHHAMANIGNNPTLNYSFEKRLEVYILDFDQNIYGKQIEIAFFHYLRQELKFKTKKDLIDQLKKDEVAVRNLTI